MDAERVCNMLNMLFVNALYRVPTVNTSPVKSLKFVLKCAHFLDQKDNIAHSEPFGNLSLSGNSIVVGRD